MSLQSTQAVVLLIVQKGRAALASLNAQSASCHHHHAEKKPQPQNQILVYGRICSDKTSLDSRCSQCLSLLFPLPIPMFDLQWRVELRYQHDFSRSLFFILEDKGSWNHGRSNTAHEAVVYNMLVPLRLVLSHMFSGLSLTWLSFWLILESLFYSSHLLPLE